MYPYGIYILITTFLIILGILIFLIFRKKSKQKSFPLISTNFYALGTFNKISIYTKNKEHVLKKCTRRISDIENKMSVFNSSSEISKINDFAGKSSVPVSFDTYYVVKKALEYCKLSKGAFDITIRPILDLWKIGKSNNDIPPLDKIKNTLNLVNYKDIVLNENKNTILLKKENQKIDLGGIAKGYAADEVKKILVKNRIKSALINLGGNIIVHGKKPNGTPFAVGIQDPLSSTGKFIGTINAINKSIVTSGNYERYFFKNGKRFHHLIDPTTGFPSESNIISSTIVSNNSIDCDGLSTSVYIMGLNKSINLIESIKNVDGIFITNDKKVYVTSGLKDNFTLTNNEYIYHEKGVF